MSGIFDYVLVTADLRASEESTDGRGTVVGKILERTIDRSAADTAYEQLAESVRAQHDDIGRRHLGSQLVDLGEELSAEVGALTTGRKITIRTCPPDLKPPKARISVSVVDDQVITPVERQGHGFQRALLISALKMLASRRPSPNKETAICFAIEEPELYQHPLQAKVFARTLRNLAGGQPGSLQVLYATHSPYFVEPPHFHQIRRVSRVKAAGPGHAMVGFSDASRQSVARRLAGVMTEDEITARWHPVCLQGISHALFADAVVLVEGETDRAVLESVKTDYGDLAARGIAVACVNGKGNFFLPFAILSELKIPTLCVFDNDVGLPDRMRSKGKSEQSIADEIQKHLRLNKDLMLRVGGVTGDDYPEGVISASLAAIPDTLEQVLEVQWPEWKHCREHLVASELGFDRKNAVTYAMATQDCSGAPPDVLGRIIDAAVNLLGESGKVALPDRAEENSGADRIPISVDLRSHAAMQDLDLNSSSCSALAADTAAALDDSQPE